MKDPDFKFTSRDALIVVTRQRPNGKEFAMRYIIKNAEAKEAPADIIEIAAMILGDFRNEVGNHPSPEEDPPSTLIAFPDQR